MFYVDHLRLVIDNCFVPGSSAILFYEPRYYKFQGNVDKLEDNFELNRGRRPGANDSTSARGDSRGAEAPAEKAEKAGRKLHGNPRLV